MIDLLKRSSYLPMLLIAFGALQGCGGADESAATGDEDDLTSVTARERTMSFDGYVYVAPDASDFSILQSIRRETKSAFGALRTAQISANTRELGEVDAKSFIKEPVTIVDAANPNGAGKAALRVRYRYTDRALVPKSMAKRSALGLGLLHGNYQSQSKRILQECTENTSHDQEFESAIWYIFNPTLSECQDAIAAEQQTIDDARKGLSDPAKQIVQAEFDRLYIPITAKFEAAATASATTYPEYDRLWTGGVQPGKVVVSIISGVMADWAAGEKPETINDVGYTMYFQQAQELLKVRPFKVVAADGADLSTYTVNGKTVNGATWTDLSNWELGNTGWPSNITSSADRLALRKAVAVKLNRHWLTWEAPVSVKIGKAAAKDVTIVLNTYYGAETDETPHRKALQTSDVVVYNGHSYIGSGPLDPTRYSSADFPKSYQMFFFNSCVSFNYYEKDFFKMKSGGTKNLDMVTNGLESWVNGSGPSVGRFVASLLNGKQLSYKNLLIETAKGAPAADVGQDALRVVDGEVDNTYKPSKTKITVTSK